MGTENKKDPSDRSAFPDRVFERQMSMMRQRFATLRPPDNNEEAAPCEQTPPSPDPPRNMDPLRKPELGDDER